MRGYGTMGLFPLEAPVDVAIAAWQWGAYLGEDGLKTGIRAKISSWRRIGSTTIPATAKAGGQYLNSILAKIETHKAGYQEAILLNERRLRGRRLRREHLPGARRRPLHPAPPGLDPRGHHPRHDHGARRRRGHPGAGARDRPRRALHRRRGVHHRHGRRGLPGQRGRRPPGRPPRPDHHAPAEPLLRRRRRAATPCRPAGSTTWRPRRPRPRRRRMPERVRDLRHHPPRRDAARGPEPHRGRAARDRGAARRVRRGVPRGRLPGEQPEVRRAFPRCSSGRTWRHAARRVRHDAPPGHRRPSDDPAMRAPGRELRARSSRSSARRGTSTSTKVLGSRARRTCG